MSEAEFLLDEDDGDAAFGIAFFGNQPGIADAVGALAVHASPCLDARSVEPAVPGSIFGRRDSPDAVYRGFYIGDDLIDAGKDDYVFRAEVDASDPVPDHVQID